MSLFRYEATIVPEDCPWSRMNPQHRSVLLRSLWVITWAGLAAGLYDERYWKWVVWFSIAHALFALAMLRGRPLVFPAQLRIAYAVWVAIGAYVPHMAWMMYVTTVGLTTNLVAGWCPMARMLYLLPWNREEPFDATLPVRVFFSKPVPGRFRATPRSSSAQQT